MNNLEYGTLQSCGLEFAGGARKQKYFHLDKELTNLYKDEKPNEAQ